MSPASGGAAERPALGGISGLTAVFFKFAEFWAAPLALGAALSLSQAPISRWLIVPLALSLAAWLLARAASPRSAARIGWLLGVGYFTPGLLWMGEAFLVEAERFAWMRPFAVTLLPMGLSLFWGAAFAGAARLGEDPVSRATALVATLTVAETLRSTVLTGFPWGLYVYALADTPLAQAAAWTGPYALNALFILISLAPFFVWRALKRGANRSGAAALALAGCALAVGLWTAGSARLASAQLELAGPTIRLVQPNIPQIEKWRPEFVERNLNILLELSAPIPGERAPDLIVWPEASTPYPLETDADLRVAVMSRLPEGSRLAFGALRQQRNDRGSREVFNSLFLVDNDAAASLVGRYDKHHLVPFGEYVPLESVLEPMGVLAIAGGRGGFAAGSGPRTISSPGLPPFQPLICYEAIFAHEIATGAKRPEWLLHVTNDAWFGDSSGPWQHLVQAQFRAIEQGLPLFRAANTGVSAVIDPYGRIVDMAPVGVRGVVKSPLIQPSEPSVYSRVSEVFLTAILTIFACIIVAFRAQKPTCV